MQEIALNELQKGGYVEDRASLRAFERRYRWLVIPGALLCLAPYPFMRLVWSPFSDPTVHSSLVSVLFLIGIALCWVAVSLAKRATPVSLRSGAPMMPFLRSDAPTNMTEYLYVDLQSHSYFARVIETYRSS
jgi:hypothetical protein